MKSKDYCLFYFQPLYIVLLFHSLSFVVEISLLFSEYIKVADSESEAPGPRQGITEHILTVMALHSSGPVLREGVLLHGGSVLG